MRVPVRRRIACSVGGVALLVGLVGTPPVVAADPDRGWSFLVDKLARDGVPRERAERVFLDERVDAFDGLNFSLNPREPYSLYRNLRTRSTAARARLCLEEHRGAFEDAQERFGVPAGVVASIVQVESGCGRNTGRARILPALARLAMAAEPENIERNIERHTLLSPAESVPTLSYWTRWRAGALEDMFYPEVKATFDIADRMEQDPLEIRGSGSGAFGIPQFLPRSYLWYGVDGNADGRVSLYDAADAIPSAARYLQYYGWRPGLSHADQRRVVWGYNHSDAYIDTVLWLADEVESPGPVPSRSHEAATAKHRKKAPAKPKPKSRATTQARRHS